MADAVQPELEGMIPELDELLQLEILTKAEIKSIIKKRTNFEYLLVRRKPEKTDFLRYLEYEKDLYALKKKRIERNNIKKRSIQGLYVSVQRIHKIFFRVKARWPKDLKLWDQHHEFCKKEKSYKILSSSLSTGIQLHPSIPHFWIQAANWNYENNENISHARALYQRGLRINAQSEELWLEYFKLELRYYLDIKQKLLKAGSSATEQDVAPAPNTENVVSVEKLDIEDTLNNEQQNFSLPKTPFLSGGIMKVIYRNAIQKIPNDINFRMKFVKEYQLCDPVGLNDGIQHIFSTIEKDFINDPKCLEILANRELDIHSSLPNKEQKVYAIYEKSLVAAETPEIWASYALFCEKMIAKANNLKKSNAILEHLLEVYSRCAAKQMLSVELLCQWIQTMLLMGKISDAKDVATNGTKVFPSSSSLWLQRIKVMIRENAFLDSKKQDQGAILKTFQKAVSLPLDHPEVVWAHYLEYCLLINVDFEEILKQFKLAVSTLGKSSLVLREAFLVRVLMSFGIDKARIVAECSLALPPSSLSFYQKCIQIEKMNSPVDTSRISKLYERATFDYGKTSEDIWLEYIRWEIDQLQLKRATQLYWEAKHNLENPTSFITKYVVLNNDLQIQ